MLGACGHTPLGSLRLPSAGAADPYAQTLIHRAHAQRLAEQRQWHKLLHYKLGVLGRGFLGGGYESEADGPEFFLSPRGKLDPQAELDATLRAMFLPLARVSAEADPNAHPVCRFPARFMYLREQLGIDVARLPVQRCPMAEQFIAELDPGSLTLIFSAYYLNNPASAFGHTFLRVNKRNSLVVGERRELLDYGIDYSADVDTGNAIIYALKAEPRALPTVQAVLERGAIDDVSRKEILDLVRRTRALERARSVAEEYAREAHAALDVLPESSYKDTLAALAYYVIDRNR